MSENPCPQGSYWSSKYRMCVPYGANAEKFYEYAIKFTDDPLFDEKREAHNWMHSDFIKIHNEFTSYYCKGLVSCERGDLEFDSWIKDMGLDPSKSYAKSQEAFVWAQDMITKYKEDEEATYWKILFAFPIKSMNYNVYTEEEIKASVKTVLTNKGGAPSLNHNEDTRKLFQKGGVKYVAAEYEDGACEAILKVPNDFVCPKCGKGKTLNSLIEDKKIINVSLEAICKLGVGPDKSCIGLEFDPPTLLTKKTLPGIPLARIFPLEKLMREAVARSRGRKKKRKIQIVGLDAPVPMEAHTHTIDVGAMIEKQLHLDKIKDLPKNLLKEGKCPDGFTLDTDYYLCLPDGITINDWRNILIKNHGWTLDDWRDHLNALGWGSDIKPVKKK